MHSASRWLHRLSSDFTVVPMAQIKRHTLTDRQADTCAQVCTDSAIGRAKAMLCCGNRSGGKLRNRLGLVWFGSIWMQRFELPESSLVWMAKKTKHIQLRRSRKKQQPSLVQVQIHRLLALRCLIRQDDYDGENNSHNLSGGGIRYAYT